MTYRASLGTRGELRRIAAEAETVTIDRVRPWIRKVQHCRLAPHVIVPQWTRLEHPVKPKPPPPLVSQSRIVAGELVEEILETATAKKFRRGRGRRGRPRKHAEAAVNPDLAPAENAEIANKSLEMALANTENAPVGVETVAESLKGAQDVSRPLETQESNDNALKAGESIEKRDEEPQTDLADKGEDVVKAQLEKKERSNEETEQNVEAESHQGKDLIPPSENEPATGQDNNIEMTPVVSEKIAAEGNIDKDVEMSEVAPVERSADISKETSS